MNTRIIIDSTTDMVVEYQNQVQTVPLTVHFGDQEYLDGVTIDNKTFYTKLAQSNQLPSTSQAAPDAFAKAFEQVKSAGDSAVVITLSSKFSGTYQSAVIAAQDYDNIHVIDSGSVAMGSGILVERAIALANQGLPAAQIASKLEQEKSDVVIVALVDTLEYLKKGGRISKAVAFAGTMLNMKPLLSVTNGEIAMIGKARGTKMGFSLLTEQMQTIDIDFARPVLLGYSGLSDEMLRQFMQASRSFFSPLPALRHTTIGSVIGTHVGPGAVAVAFFKPSLPNP